MKKEFECTKCGCVISGEYTLCALCYKRLNAQRERDRTTDYQMYVNINSKPEVRKLYDIGSIWSNSISCKKCGDTIRSKNRHDMVWCSCRSVSVDGGSWYTKVSGKLDLVESKVIPFNVLSDEEK